MCTSWCSAMLCLSAAVLFVWGDADDMYCHLLQCCCCCSHGLGLTTWSPLASGILTGEPQQQQRQQQQHCCKAAGWCSCVRSNGASKLALPATSLQPAYSGQAASATGNRCVQLAYMQSALLERDMVRTTFLTLSAMHCIACTPQASTVAVPSQRAAGLHWLTTRCATTGCSATCALYAAQHRTDACQVIS
jgi:hypothetical protein